MWCDIIVLTSFKLMLYTLKKGSAYAHIVLKCMRKCYKIYSVLLLFRIQGAFGKKPVFMRVATTFYINVKPR